MTKEAIARSVDETARKAFGDGRLGVMMTTQPFGATTADIKKIFYELGHKHNFLVATAQSIGADDGEWLFDMGWYTEDEGFTTRIALILESEIYVSQERGEINSDFMKLVAARAEVRVWLACVANHEEVAAHMKLCQEQVRRFAGTEPGDVYVFIIFEWATKGVIIETYTVPETTGLVKAA